MSRFPVAGFDLSGVGFESERRESELWEAAVAAWLQLGSCAVSFQPVRGYSAPASCWLRLLLWSSTTSDTDLKMSRSLVAGA